MSPRSSFSVGPSREHVHETRIASPCNASWEEMEGDDKVRFCAGCRLNVYTLSAMDIEEAAEVLANREGRLCARFYRRKDGTVLTQDCQAGVDYRNARRAFVSAAGVAAAAVVSFGAFVPVMSMMQPTMGSVALTPPPEHVPIYAAIQGDIETLRAQLAEGWDPNTRLSDGSTALMYASRRGETEAMKLLIDHGADVNARDFGGLSTLQKAKEAGQAAAIKVLKAAGAR